jgi:hypothetical protein
MGLSIATYATVERIGDAADQYDSATEGNLYVEKGRENRAGTITTGLYRLSKERFKFHGGSYHNYNDWRRWLCQVMLGVMPEAVWQDTQKYAGRQFVELIHFSDCEGTLGPAVCAKLARDFADFEATAEASGAPDDIEDDWYMKQYRNFKVAFQLAAGEGAVEFC